MSKSLEQLKKELEQEYANYRYYHATDDLGSWEKERGERFACSVRCSLHGVPLTKSGVSAPQTSSSTRKPRPAEIAVSSRNAGATLRH